MERKPILSPLWSCGPALVYPVTVRTGLRKCEDRWLLIPLHSWEDGERVFFFVEGTTIIKQLYKPGLKLRAKIRHTMKVIDQYSYAAYEYGKAEVQPNAEVMSRMQEIMDRLDPECENISYLRWRYSRLKQK